MLGLAELLNRQFGLLLGLGVGVALGDVLQGLRDLFHELVALAVVLGLLFGASQFFLGAALGSLMEGRSGDGFLASHGRYSFSLIANSPWRERSPFARPFEAADTRTRSLQNPV